MHNSNFKKLALMGMVGGALIAAQSPAVADESAASKNVSGHSGCGASGCSHKSSNSGCGANSGKGFTADASTDTNMAGRKMLTETELLNRLNDSTRAQYSSLSPEGKALALKLASSDQYKDKNDAVKEAAKQMANKSQSVNKNY